MDACRFVATFDRVPPIPQLEIFRALAGSRLSFAGEAAVLHVERHGESANAAIMALIRELAKLGFSVISVAPVPAR